MVREVTAHRLIGQASFSDRLLGPDLTCCSTELYARLVPGPGPSVEPKVLIIKNNNESLSHNQYYVK
jgi:hypothetical protein